MILLTYQIKICIFRQADGWKRANLKLLSSLSPKCNKVKRAKGLTYIKSPDWRRYKNAIIIPIKVGDKCFQFALALTQHYKELKYHFERVSNIKPGIEYPTVINKCN